MVAFPLYEKLTSGPQFTLDEIYQLSGVLKDPDASVVEQRSIELFYLLLHHYTINGGNPKLFQDADLAKSRNRLNLPYGIKVNTIGKSLSFNLADCPPDLQQIIGAYFSSL